MSLLYNQTNKQVQQLKRDINSLRKSLDNGDSPNVSISLIGAISSTISSIGRSIDDFQSYINNQEEGSLKAKNQKRAENIRFEYGELKVEFEDLRKRRDEAIRALKEQERSNLFMETNMANASGVSDNPYNVGYRGKQVERKESEMMMDQQIKMERGNAKLDEILEMGRAAFDDIVQQNETIAKVKDKMSAGLHTLGVSHGTVVQIEKVMFEDKVIFYLGATLTLFTMYLIWSYLG